jgi:hypothetical protein
MMALRGVIVSVVGLPRVPREVVDRHLDGLPGAQRVHVLHEQVRLERVGMVVVERRPLLEPQVVAVAVVPIVLEHGDLAVADALDDAADDRGLAGAGPAGDADDEGMRHAPHIVGAAPPGVCHDRTRIPRNHMKRVPLRRAGAPGAFRVNPCNPCESVASVMVPATSVG